MATESAAAKSAFYKILREPIITEKASMLGSTVVLRVDTRATKPEIKEAVEKVFNVKVDEVRTLRYLGKIKRTGKSVGRRSNWKKAYVTLKEGEKINLVEGL